MRNKPKNHLWPKQPPLCIFLLAAGLLCLVPAGAHAAGTGYTMGSYCDILKSTAKSYAENAEVSAQLNREWNTLCSDLSLNEEQRDYTGVVNAYIGSDPGRAIVTPPNTSIVQGGQEGRDLEERYQNAREAATELASKCMAQSGQSMAPSDTLFERVLSQMSTTQFEQACSQIPNYTQSANQGVTNADTTCRKIHESCEQVMNAVNEYFREARGTIAMTASMNANRAVGHNSCNLIANRIPKLQQKVEEASRSLSVSCESARQAALNKKKTTEEEKKKQATDDRNKQLLNAAATALPQIANMFNSATPTGPSDLGDGSTRQPELNYGLGESSALPMAGKGYAPPASAMPTDIGDGTIMDQGLESPAPREATPYGQYSQNAGGGSAGVNASGSRGAEGAARARGRSAGGKLNADVYSGIQAAGTMNRAGNGGGYPETEGIHNRGLRGQWPRARAQGGVAGVRGVTDLRNFLPRWHVNRRAAAAAGPDGMTGPHSNMWSNVRARYSMVPLIIDPLSAAVPAKPAHLRGQ